MLTRRILEVICGLTQPQLTLYTKQSKLLKMKQDLQNSSLPTPTQNRLFNLHLWALSSWQKLRKAICSSKNERLLTVM